MQTGFVAKMAPVGKLFDRSVCQKSLANQAAITCSMHRQQAIPRGKGGPKRGHDRARNRPDLLQLYTLCILEIGKNSMEGLQEMRDSEKPTERLPIESTSSNSQAIPGKRCPPRTRKRRPPQNSSPLGS